MLEKINGMPEAVAELRGAGENSRLHGRVYFYDVYGGTIVIAEVYGLPDGQGNKDGQFFGFHIHEGEDCEGTPEDPFADTKGHDNPKGVPHPYHAGDLPPLLSSSGAAWSAVYTGRFHPDDVVGKTVVVHDMPDDFRSQPAGDSGRKIACGKIRDWMIQPREMEEQG